jgi:hypothetical protein
MKYLVRVYCHDSYEAECSCQPRHPFILEESFDSIRAANDRGGKVVAAEGRDDLEWEVLDEKGNSVC